MSHPAMRKDKNTTEQPLKMGLFQLLKVRMSILLKWINHCYLGFKCYNIPSDDSLQELGASSFKCTPLAQLSFSFTVNVAAMLPLEVV